MSKTLIKPPLPKLDFSNPLTKGLVACYPFFEKGGTKLRDISGKNNHGTLTNMDPATDWVKTPYGYGLDFDGVDGRVIAGTINITGTAQRTISGWMNFTAFNSYNAGYLRNTLCGWGSNDPLTGNFLGVHNGKIAFATGNNDTIFLGTTDILVNTDYFFTATYDSSIVRLFLNGKYEGQGTVALNTTTATPLGIGYCYHISYGALNGVIYNLCIYNRALSAKGIATLYTNPNCIYLRPKLFSLGKVIPDITLPVLSNLTVTTGTNDGELNISFNYTEETSVVTDCEIAIARIDTDLPSGAHTGTETDNLVYNVFKPIYKTTQSEIPAMAQNASGTYSVILKLPDNGKVYVTASAKDNSGKWANWMTPISGTVKGTGGTGGGEYSFGMAG